MAPVFFPLIALFVVTLKGPSLCEAIPLGGINPDVCLTPACREAAQIILDSIDTTVDPCEDFFRYSCGGFFEKYPIPEGASEYGAFHILIDEIQRRLTDMLRTAGNEIHSKPVMDAASLFAGCIDSEARDAEGLNSLRELLATFGGWPIVDPEWSDTGYQWHIQVATVMRTLGIKSIFAFLIDTDPSRSSVNIVNLGARNSLGLDSDILKNLTASEGIEMVVQAYKNFMISTAKLLNPNLDETVLNQDVEDMTEFISSLARLNVSDAGQDDARKRKLIDSEDITEDSSGQSSGGNETEEYIRCTVSELQRFTKNTYFEWKDFLNVLFQDFPEVTDETEIILHDKDYMEQVLELISNTSPRTFANYLGWIVVKLLGQQTTNDFKGISFAFQQLTYGIEKPQDLEKTCTDTVTKLLSFAASRLYVDKYFSEEAKCDAEKLIADIRAAYEISLNHNTWMDPETKNRALEKLRSMVTFVGYPSWIKNDEELTQYYHALPVVKEDQYFASLVKVRGAVTAIELRTWNQQSHRTTDFFANPTTVNAFYKPSVNGMMFPAAILNPPFYKYGRVPAINYGAMGSTIGHEISHGYDNTGSQYGNEGNKENWWSTDTKQEFDNKANCLKNQYSKIVEPTTEKNVNGTLTLGDNIADNGGIRIAFMAYQMQLLQAEENQITRSSNQLPGLSITPEQLFFLGYAMTTCVHREVSTMEWGLKHDEHAPAEFRVNVPLGNFKAFSDAFNCPVGSRMNPEAKCQLW